MKNSKLLLICLLSIVRYSEALMQLMGTDFAPETQFGQLHLNCPKYDDPGHPVMLMYPSNCKMYYLCAGGQVFPQMCPNNLYWSQITKSCDRKELSTCASTEITVPTINPSKVTPTNSECLSVTFSPLPGDRNRFYEICERSCSTGLSWDIKTEHCVLSREANCKRPVTPILPPISEPVQSLQPNAKLPTTNADYQLISNRILETICSNNRQLYLPYPGDCTKFIQCDYKPFVKYCPPFLLWNSKLNTCDKVCI